MALRAGNNPWPIGVTSIGIHERSSREKISHVMNGAAHIMNDEATRKYLQVLHDGLLQPHRHVGMSVPLPLLCHKRPPLSATRSLHFTQKCLPFAAEAITLVS